MRTEFFRRASLLLPGLRASVAGSGSPVSRATMWDLVRPVFDLRWYACWRDGPVPSVKGLRSGQGEETEQG